MELLVSKFDSSNLKLIDEGQHYQPPASLAPLIEQQWQKVTREAAQKGGQVWNGLVYRLDHLSRQNGTTTLHLGSVDFKAHYASRDLKAKLLLLPENQRPNGLIISSYLITSDDQYIFGFRSNSSILANKIQFIGGNINKDEQEIHSVDDLYAYFLKELSEETGFDKTIIASTDGLGIFLNDNLRIAVLLRTKLNITAADFLQSARLEAEHSHLLALTRSQLQEMISDPASDINPMIGQSLNLTRTD